MSERIQQPTQVWLIYFFSAPKIVWLHKKHIAIIFNFQTNLIDINFPAFSSRVMPRPWVVCFNMSDSSLPPFLNCHCYDSTFHLFSSPGSYLGANTSVDVTLWNRHPSLDIISGSRHIYIQVPWLSLQRWNKLCWNEPLKTRLSPPSPLSWTENETWGQGRKCTEVDSPPVDFQSKPQSLTKSEQLFSIWFLLVMMFAVVLCAVNRLSNLHNSGI